MQTNPNTPSPRRVPHTDVDLGFYSMKEVCDLTGFSRTHIYRLEAAGLFVRRRKLGLAKIGFKRVEVDDWLANRPFAPLRSDDDE